MSALESIAAVTAHVDTQKMRERIQALLASGKLEVPLQPEVAATVIASSDESFDFRRVSEQVHRDQALAGHVLRIANSVAISGRCRIVSLQQALVRLGTRRVKELVVAVVMKTRIFRSNRHANQAEVIWREAAATAFVAREIARHIRRNPESAFLCGLLHSVGKPIVLNLLAELEKEQEQCLSEETVRTLIEEFYVLGGERLIRPWALPPSVAEAIRCHQHPESAQQHKEMVTIIAVAKEMAALVLSEASDEELVSQPKYASLHLYPDDVEQILRRVNDVRTYIEAVA